MVAKCLVVVVVVSIGAVSMGAIAPTAKKLWGRCLQVAAQEFCYVAVVHSQKVQ